MAHKDSHEALLTALKEPFDPKLVKWTTKGGKTGEPKAYVDARDVMKRLDTVLGIAGWQDKYIEVDGGFTCELSINVSIDEKNPIWITKSNGASRTKIEPVKGGHSDALKRAAVNFGIGRYLYYIPSSYARTPHSEWSTIFLPGAPENWEDIAELEAEANTGLDFDYEEIPEGYDLVAACETQEELDKLIKSLGDEQAASLADDINAKRRELFHASQLQADTSQSPAA